MPLKTYPDSIGAIIGDLGEGEDPETLDLNEIKTRAQSRRFDLSAPPSKPVPRFFIHGKPWATPKNIQSILAQAGAGKSSLIGATMAAYMAPGADTGRDCLGMSASDPQGLPLLHVDTEQSPYDHHAMILRTLKRAGVDAPPEGFHSFGLAGFSAEELRAFLPLAVEDLAIEHGGVFAVIIDGIADFVADVNDAEECNKLVSELHALAIKYDTALVLVVHENPGSDNGKARGHLGSQLERKVETALRLKRTEETTTVYSHKARHAPIFEADGPRFAWSDSECMHVSVQAASVDRDEKKREKAHDLAESVFLHLAKPGARYAEFVRAIAEVRRFGASAAEARFSDMKRLGVIQKNSITGEWALANPSDYPTTL